jgi:PAS domain-containing protein
MYPDKKRSRRGGTGYALMVLGMALAVFLLSFMGWAAASVQEKKILILFPLEENIPAFTTFLLYVCVLEDGRGGTLIPRDALAAISRQASAPVYGAIGTYLGHGIVGGRLYSYELQATRTAQWALRLLGEELPADLPGVDEGGNETLFDWRELQRWGISEAKLPPGSTVRFKPFSAWDLYKWRIIGMLSLLAVQALLILGLVIQLRQRRRAESSLRESEERMSLALTSADLFLWEWDIPRDRIWATERARAFFVSKRMPN